MTHQPAAILTAVCQWVERNARGSAACRPRSGVSTIAG
jgi:hypothetical protein